MHIKRLWKTVLFIAVIITMILYSGCSENEDLLSCLINMQTLGVKWTLIPCTI